MANITKRTNEEGQPSYYFRVFAGRGIDGRQRRLSMTWTPPAGMTGRQADKQARIEAQRFEDRVNAGMVQDANIRLKDYAEKWLEEYARPQLKLKTVEDYEKLLPRIYEALGHLKLREIRPGHLTRFYLDLQKGDARKNIRYAPKPAYNKHVEALGLRKEQFAKLSGVNSSILRAMSTGANVTLSTAEKLAAAIGRPLEEVFFPATPCTPLHPNTVRHYHRLLSSMLTKAVKWGYIPFNPASNAELPKTQHTEAAFLEEGEARRFLLLLQDAPIKWRAAVIFALLSGLRRGELLGLRWSDVDFDTETIRIVQTSSYVKGKGLITDTPKNKTSARPLKLARSAFLILREYQAWQRERKRICGDYWKDVDERVFTNEEGKPLHPDALTRWVSGFAKQNGFEGIHLHSLRHSYASLMIADGTPLLVVSRRMGHAQVSTTANIYAHMIASANEKAAQVTERFSDIIAAPLEDRPAKKVYRLRLSSRSQKNA